MTQQSPSDNNFPLVPALVFFGGITLILVALFASQPAKPATGAASTPTTVAIVQPTSASAPVQVASSGALDPVQVKAGETIFQTICSACHGFNALGIPGLGKTLIGSEFFNTRTDAEMVAFLQVGRPVTDPLNTTGVMMPPKGGNPGLTDADLLNVIAYIRSLNGAAVATPSAEQIAAAAAQPTLPPAEFNAGAFSALVGGGATAVPAEATAAPEATSAAEVTAAPEATAAAEVTAAPEATSAAEATTAPEATAVPTEVSAAPTTASADTFAPPGQKDYAQACAGCHGAKGEGVPLLTKPLSESNLVQSLNTFGIMNLFTSTTPPAGGGFLHPYRGGTPELTDNQLLGIATYLLTMPK